MKVGGSQTSGKGWTGNWKVISIPGSFCSRSPVIGLCLRITSAHVAGGRRPPHPPTSRAPGSSRKTDLTLGGEGRCYTPKLPLESI